MDYYHNKLSDAASSPFLYFVFPATICSMAIQLRINNIYRPNNNYASVTRHNILRCGESQTALEFCPIHCPSGRLGQDLDFGGFAFALKLPELLNTNLAAVRAKLGQTSCFPNGPQIWCPIGQ